MEAGPPPPPPPPLPPPLPPLSPLPPLWLCDEATLLWLLSSAATLSLPLPRLPPLVRVRVRIKC